MMELMKLAQGKAEEMGDTCSILLHCNARKSYIVVLIWCLKILYTVL